MRRIWRRKRILWVHGKGKSRHPATQALLSTNTRMSYYCSRPDCKNTYDCGVGFYGESFCSRECARKNARRNFPGWKLDVLKDCMDDGLDGQAVFKKLIAPEGSWHEFYMLAIEPPPLLCIPPPTSSSPAKKKATIVNGVLTWN